MLAVEYLPLYELKDNNNNNNNEIRLIIQNKFIISVGCIFKKEITLAPGVL